MARIHYEEVQRFSQVRWMWILAAIMLLTPLVIFTLSQTHDANYSAMFLTMFAGSFPLALLIAFGKYEVHVNDAGFKYRFLPGVFQWKVIHKERIASVDVRQKKGLYERLACGYRRRVLTKTVFMNITGNKLVIITLSDGLRIKMGSQHTESLGQAIKQLSKANNLI